MSESDHRIYCDMTSAPDTAKERLVEYRALFDEALIARERTVAGIRFRFRADEGVERRVRSLARREKACCSFFSFDVNHVGGEVLWDARVVDDDTAREVLEQFYRLPETLGGGTLTAYERFTAVGLHVAVDDGSGLRRATFAELGFSDADRIDD